MTEMKCPRCGSIMVDDGMTISSNTKYKHWRCEVCNHKQTKCLGINDGV